MIKENHLVFVLLFVFLLFGNNYIFSSYAQYSNSIGEITSSQNYGFNTLKNLKYGFSIDFPSYLEPIEQVSEDPNAEYVIDFLSGGSFYLEVAIWKLSDFESNTHGNDYLNYMIDYEKNICENSMLYRNAGCSDYKLENAQIIKINGIEAYQIKHTYKHIPLQENEIYVTDIVTDFKTPEFGWTIYAYTNTNEFYKFEKDIQTTLNSFILTNAVAASEPPPVSESVCGEGTVMKDGKCVVDKKESGGCLIATATFGSELAPQVQFLREIRDNTVLSTASGASFMTAFNAFYYSLSPTIADLERQSPIFKETVKVALTPLLSSLSVLQYVDIDSDAEMLGYGIGIILLNIGMYFVMPAFVLLKLKSKLA